jgi:hypothetical protein
MAENDSSTSWGSHQWLDRRPRHFELESGQSIFESRCTRCGRDFAVEISSGARYGIRASVFSFHRLHDEVTERWLSQPCPGERLQSDLHDKNRWIAELRISWTRSRKEKQNLLSRV